MNIKTRRVIYSNLNKHILHCAFVHNISCNLRKVVGHVTTRRCYIPRCVETARFPLIRRRASLDRVSSHWQILDVSTHVNFYSVWNASFLRYTFCVYWTGRIMGIYYTAWRKEYYHLDHENKIRNTIVYDLINNNTWKKPIKQ